VTVTEPCCPECGSPRDRAEIVDCPDCGRPLGVCASPACLRLFRLFVSDDRADCDGCREKDPGEETGLLAANGTCPECGRPWRSPGGPCVICSMTERLKRMTEQHEQMRKRSGPHYDLATQRGRIIKAAWRAAGSPVRLQRVHGGRWYLYASWKRGDRQEATLGQVAAWEAWCIERFRLRHELGWDRPIETNHD
jgi:hypothetical protein